MKKVCLLLIATGKYDQFLPRVVESVKKNFLKDCEVFIHLFTDKIDFRNNKISDNIIAGDYEGIHFVEHRPFPYTTLMRFHFFNTYKNIINEYDYYFYLDVDTEIKEPITEEILSERTAVQHCGFVNKKGPFETRVLSSCYVPETKTTSPYYGGGFWGFSNNEFWKFIENAIFMIWHDERKGIVPIWHDESVLNKYLLTNTPTKVLSPSYHYPEGNIEHYKEMWTEEYECKILLLDKNHKEVRA